MTWPTMLLKLVRIASLILVAALGTISLMRFAPGYFTDAREMDAEYAEGARAALKTQAGHQGSVFELTKGLLGGWLHGDLGRSKQFDVPVTELLEPRARVTARLLLYGVGCGWMLACALALPLSAGRSERGEALIAGPNAVLLAIPIGALATGCLLLNSGGALTVLTAIIAVRDFKLVYRVLREGGRASHLLYARALGLRSHRIVWVHLLPPLTRQLLGLAMVSLVTALSAIVPVEVVFDVPGLGQLAWSAAMNRDLPVLLAVTLLVAAVVGIASMIVEHEQLEAIL